MFTANANADSLAHDQRRGSGFWIVAYALLIVMAFATLPSPLFGLYRLRDHLSAITITIVFAIYSVSTVSVLVAVPRIAARIGRRGVMLVAVATMMIAAGVLAAWKGLPALLIGRVITGAAAGLAAGTAIAYLMELSLRSNPNASLVRARNIGASITVGALGVGPLVAGALAQWASWPLTLPYVVFVALGAVGLGGILVVPETAPPGSRRISKSPTKSSSARLPIPAAAATFAAFGASGLISGLAGIILTTTLHHPSHALAGATLFLVFFSGVVSQLSTANLQSARVLALGTSSMLIGLVLFVLSVRLSVPNLALFLVGGALIGTGFGAVFKGTTGIVLEAAAPEDRLKMTARLLIALYLGLSVPVVGVGIALNEGASIPDTVFGFAILVAVGVTASGRVLFHQNKGKSHTNQAGS